MGCYRYPLAALLATAVILIASPFAAADPPLPGLHWFAPVLAGGGYCSEANALLHGLKSLPPGEAPPLRVTHHGDAIDYFFYSGLPEDYARELDSMLTARQPRARDSVIVCHSEPGAWAPAKYETARCPPEGLRPATRGEGHRSYHVRDGQARPRARGAVQQDGRGVGADEMERGSVRAVRRGPA